MGRETSTGEIAEAMKRQSEHLQRSERMNKADLENRFSYHAPPNEAVVEAHELVRHQMRGAAEMVLDQTPECREQSLAITKLEEAMYWANAAIARNHAHYLIDSDDAALAAEDESPIAEDSGG